MKRNRQQELGTNTCSGFTNHTFFSASSYVPNSHFSYTKLGAKSVCTHSFCRTCNPVFISISVFSVQSLTHIRNIIAETRLIHPKYLEIHPKDHLLHDGFLSTQVSDSYRSVGSVMTLTQL